MRVNVYQCLRLKRFDMLTHQRVATHFNANFVTYSLGNVKGNPNCVVETRL